ncbi:ferritin family protein [candidate division WOR-3 bacterium]|nr:ferritin family protein [candidate division WOR-3 bacterium]
MSLFEPSEVFQFAIRIEENGEKFYRQMVQKFDEPKIKELFSFLVDEEIKHKKIYEEMVSKIEKYEPFETFPGEYFAYLRAYADKIIFTQEEFDEEIARIKDINAALDYAINAELDSILYYQEIKNLVSENQRSTIDKIIEEERRHFVKLSEIKRTIK